MEGRRRAWLTRSRGWIVVFAVLLGGLGLALVGLHTLNGFARDQLHEQGRDRVAFLDIDCTPPAGRTRTDFLREVRYQSGLPSHLAVFESGLVQRLAQAFAKHPCVAHVKRVEIGPDQQIHVELLYRTPVLAVVGRMHSFQVDAHGVHLGPVNDPSLPVYRLASGTRSSSLNESAIKAAAETVVFLRPNHRKLRIQSIDGPGEKLILHGGWNGSVIWGHAPGAEPPEEARAETKRARLLKHVAQPDGSDEPFDLR